MIDCEVIWNKEKTEAAWESAYFFENVDKLNLVRTIGEQAPNRNILPFALKKLVI